MWMYGSPPFQMFLDLRDTGIKKKKIFLIEKKRYRRKKLERKRERTKKRKER